MPWKNGEYIWSDPSWFGRVYGSPLLPPLPSFGMPWAAGEESSAPFPVVDRDKYFRRNSSSLAQPSKSEVSV